jgi:cobalt/nickel transport system permease protein
VPLAGGLAAGAGSLAAAGAATLAFVVGGTDAVPASAVAASIGGAHVLLALVEGALTAAILATVLRLRPDLVRAVRRPRPAADEQVPLAAGADQ